MTRTDKKKDMRDFGGKGLKSTKMTKQRNHKRTRTSQRSAIVRYSQGNSIGLEYEATYRPSRNQPQAIDPCVCCRSYYDGNRARGIKGKGLWGG